MIKVKKGGLRLCASLYWSMTIPWSAIVRLVVRAISPQRWFLRVGRENEVHEGSLQVQAGSSTPRL